MSRRILALSADRDFGAQLRAALEAAGEVTLASTLGSIDHALAVVHLDGALADAMPAVLAALPAGARAIAILPRSDLARIVALMQADARMAGVVVAERFDGARLAAMVAGELRPHGIAALEQTVGDYADKSRCIAQVSALAEGMRVRRKYRAAIETCLDEMLMNALYDAPPRRDVPPQRATVQFAGDGARCYLTVRDGYGSLQRATVLRYLHKCLHEKQQIDRKVGGAGLGLYFMTSASSEIYFRVARGRSTEVTCVFELTSPNLALHGFGCAFEDAPAAPRRYLVPALLAAIAATLLAIAWLAR